MLLFRPLFINFNKWRIFQLQQLMIVIACILSGWKYLNSARAVLWSTEMMVFTGWGEGYTWGCVACPAVCQERAGEPLGSWAGGIWTLAVFVGKWSLEWATFKTMLKLCLGNTKLEQFETEWGNELTGSMDNHMPCAQICLPWFPFYLAV